MGVGVDSRRLQRHPAIPELLVGRLYMILTVVAAQRNGNGNVGTMGKQSTTKYQRRRMLTRAVTQWTDAYINPGESTRIILTRVSG